MKKLFLIFICFMIILCLTGCSLYTYFNDEYFIYGKKLGDDFVCLCDFTDKGKEQKYLVIPSEYNGLPVVIKSTGLYGHYIELVSDSLLKLFVPYQNSGIPSLIISTSNDDYDVKISKVFVITNNVSPLTLKNSKENIYVTNKYYCDNEKFRPDKYDDYHRANVSYFYNYEDAPNDGYYWIDDYDNELIDYIPENPTRKGYIFDGWYKEVECINKWDFDVDIIPAKEYDKKENYIYVENCLYAKWREN